MFAPGDSGLGAKADALIDQFRIRHVADKKAGELSYGQQKLVDIAMAFMSEPDLVLLDEPCAGVNPSLVGGISTLLKELNQTRRADGKHSFIRGHRAQHGLRDGPVPPHHGDGRGHGDGRSARRPRSAPTSRCSTPTWGTDACQTDIAIEFDDVVAGYGEFMILNNLSFKARRGKITLLLGPNGAGKSHGAEDAVRPAQGAPGPHPARRPDITGATAKDLLAQARHRLRAAGPQPVRPAHA